VRVVVIGGTGHIGSYLVPRLVRAGHDVVSISRGQSPPYLTDDSWAAVEQLVLDKEAEEQRGTFGQLVAGLRPDAVVDLLCYTMASATQLAAALRGSPAYLLHCGTIWVLGPATAVPVTEDAPRRPILEYGVHKAAVEEFLLTEAAQGRLQATVLHPGHVVGPGWLPVNPAGYFRPDIYGELARGEEVSLPHLGLETLHHVHADDVAQAFTLALDQPSRAVGQAFHVVSEQALTMRGFAEAVASWFGQEPRLRYEPWETWRQEHDPEDVEHTWNHLRHSPCISMAKARRMLGYAPRYSSLDALHEAVAWLAEHGQIETGGHPMRHLPAGQAVGQV
jgi:nucleoside-diphosphate-sugar epimerase